MGTAITNAISSGFAIAGQFGQMISNTFNSVFITNNAPNSFAIVALTLTGVAIVTGIAMKVFNKFMGGKI